MNRPLESTDFILHDRNHTGESSRGRKVGDGNVSSTFFGKQGERLLEKNEKVEFIFPFF